MKHVSVVGYLSLFSVLNFQAHLFHHILDQVDGMNAASCKAVPCRAAGPAHTLEAQSEDLLPAKSFSWSRPSEATCYVCEMRGVPGKFDHAAAEALGVPKGPVSKAPGHTFWHQHQY
jgi:hypothetical protein